MPFRFAPEIRNIDIPLGVTLNPNDFEAGHRRGGWIRTVRGCWNQADVSMAFAPMLEIFTDRQQPRVFPLRSGVWLDSNCVESGDFGQIGLQFCDQLEISRDLSFRSKRMNLTELRPGNRQHFSRSIQFHRT